MTTPDTGPAAWLDSYRMDLKSALAAAASDGYRGVLASALSTELDPREFGGSARRHLARHLRNLGLSLGGLTLVWPGRGLTDPQHADARVEQLRRTLELCRDLGVVDACAALGGDSAPDGGVLERVADLSDRIGVTVSLQAGELALTDAVAAVRRVDCPTLRLLVDSAQAATAAVNPQQLERVAGLATLRDARRAGPQFEEVEFGQGDVDFAAFLGLLDAAGGSRGLAIRRDARAVGVDAMRRGREYIRSLLAARDTR